MDGCRKVLTPRGQAARIYDYWLGGAHNFEADRRVAEKMLAAYPQGQPIAWSNRAFLRRAVEFLVDAGVRQFLDIGSGVPTVGHVHEVAQAAAPESRVVFVDMDPVAVAHSRLILAGNDRAAVIQEDVRRPEQIFSAPEMRLLDLDQPVAVLLVSLLHFVPDNDDPPGILTRLTTPFVSGSYLALSHGTNDGPRDMTVGAEIYRQAGIDVTLRNRSVVEDVNSGTVRRLRPRGARDRMDAAVASRIPQRPLLRSTRAIHVLRGRRAQALSTESPSCGSGELGADHRQQP